MLNVCRLAEVSTLRVLVCLVMSCRLVDYFTNVMRQWSGASSLLTWLLVPVTEHPEKVICMKIVFCGLSMAGEYHKNYALIMQSLCFWHAQSIFAHREPESDHTAACKQVTRKYTFQKISFSWKSTKSLKKLLCLKKLIVLTIGYIACLLHRITGTFVPCAFRYFFSQWSTSVY